MKVKCFPIWHEGGEDKNLPSECELEIPDKDKPYIDDILSDMLEDEYGWSVTSVKYEILDGEEEDVG